METSLRYNSETKSLCIHAKAKFPVQKNLFFQALNHTDTMERAYVTQQTFAQACEDKVHGELNTYTPTHNHFSVFTGYLNPEFSTSLGLGIRHDKKEKLTYNLRGKTAFPITSDGSLRLDIKGKSVLDKDLIEKRRRGAVELTWSILNFREDQDVRLKVGYEILEKMPYLQIRENNWTVNADAKGRWNVRYDL